ncbi:MAG TPA: SCO family protein [Tepidisphaeraceae bacterium]|jgi:cytochrome oxidase Cu insertion factor (SCO1/SenC/PrrC family)|nr:SCO family protein [Tepidisphaeraceae bacterium]
MTKNLKRLTIALWVLCVLVSVTVVLAYYRSRDVLAAMDAPTAAPHVVPAMAPDLSTRLFPVPDFALRDENEKPVTQQTLSGKPWIAAFIFTNCAGACPMMSKHMATLQTKIASPDVRLVSFTLDPKRDTPAVLKSYATKIGAQPGRWFFLSGTTEEMQAVARGMLIGIGDPPEGSDQFTHSSKFLLVDGTNMVRGIYEGTSEDVLDQLAADAEKLARE